MLILIGAWYALAGMATLIAYGLDKRAARNGTWRTKERTLHLLAFAGGWPGALAGQTLIRHKSRKLSFKLVTWGAAALHVGAWVALIVLVRSWKV
jgi:uncharacterized membrane protein YsdA (DUF1294 family)